MSLQHQPCCCPGGAVCGGLACDGNFMSGFTEFELDITAAAGANTCVQRATNGPFTLTKVSTQIPIHQDFAPFAVVSLGPNPIKGAECGHWAYFDHFFCSPDEFSFVYYLDFIVLRPNYPFKDPITGGMPDINLPSSLTFPTEHRYQYQAGGLLVMLVLARNAGPEALWIKHIPGSYSDNNLADCHVFDELQLDLYGQIGFGALPNNVILRLQLP